MKEFSALLALSGGLDSTTLLASLLNDGKTVTCIVFDYGSKHGPYENEAAFRIAVHYGVNYFLAPIKGAFNLIESNLLFKGDSIPEGHYNDPRQSQTVVPGRNMIMLSILTGIAQSMGIPAVYMGMHAGDHQIYPDCRIDFLAAITLAGLIATEGAVKIYAPFSTMNKRGIIDLGFALRAPYQLTRTCYKNQTVACGRCGACQERLAAFAAAGRTDPLDYESTELIRG